MPMRLGTSSPKTIVRYVTTMTIAALRHCRRRCQRHTQPRQYHTETVCKRSARIDTRKDTYERDSDLHRREETVRILRKAQRQLGRAAALRRLSLEIRLARRE